MQTDGKTIPEEIVCIMKKVDLDVNNCQGQEYDDTVNMPSEVIGVQRIIKSNSSEKSAYTHCCGHNLALVICSEKSAYTHCCGHNLALVICTACKLVIIINALDIVKDTGMMFVRGSKKMRLLRGVVKKNPHFLKHQKLIIDICVTRWVEILDGYNMFLIVYLFITEAFEVVALKLHLERYTEWSIFDQESRSRANRALGSLCNFAC